MAIRNKRPNRNGLVKSEGSKLRYENKELKKRIEALEKQLSIHVVSNSTKVNKPKLSVKCLHCGRKIIGKMHHKCNTGYRKRNHSWQEITED